MSIISLVRNLIKSMLFTPFMAIKGDLSFVYVK